MTARDMASAAVKGPIVVVVVASLRSQRRAGRIRDDELSARLSVAALGLLHGKIFTGLLGFASWRRTRA